MVTPSVLSSPLTAPAHVARAQMLALLLLALPASATRSATLEAELRDAKGQPVANAVVYLSPETVVPAPPARAPRAVIDQIDKEFVPRVVPVSTGSRVDFPNHDDIRHHVYSFSQAKQFELPLYQGTPAQPVSFDKAGVVKLGCNIHDWMRGYILVLDTPWFAASDARGVARVDDLPAGTFRVTAWHPDLPRGEPVEHARIEFGHDAIRRVTVTLELKPELRIRRAPAARQARQY
jgi:plastocyanin